MEGHGQKEEKNERGIGKLYKSSLSKKTVKQRMCGLLRGRRKKMNHRIQQIEEMVEG